MKGMGLETIACRAPGRRLSKADVAAFAAADVRLCECFGDTRFRGKLYTRLVREATGEDLPYEGMRADPATVRRMADALERADASGVSNRLDEPVDEVERDLKELARFFRLCADRGLGLRGG